MFTGLIEEEGTVHKLRRRGGSVMFTFRAGKTVRRLKIDDSISVNGVCLTVIQATQSSFTVQAVEETLQKTNLGDLNVGDSVNLERALLPGDRLGGHFVLGHIDGACAVTRIVKRKSSWMFWFQMPRRFARYLIPVGSIAINGVSLTIASLRRNDFAVSIIPHTWELTTFKDLRVGDRVNVEFDMLGKYVERLLEHRKR